jgi:hypothetical protein
LNQTQTSCDLSKQEIHLTALVLEEAIQVKQVSYLDGNQYHCRWDLVCELESVLLVIPKLPRQPKVGRLVLILILMLLVAG